MFLPAGSRRDESWSAEWPPRDPPSPHTLAGQHTPTHPRGAPDKGHHTAATTHSGGGDVLLLFHLPLRTIWQILMLWVST